MKKCGHHKEYDDMCNMCNYVKVQELNDQNTALLAELKAISDALGTNEGHSSVEHIKALQKSCKETDAMIASLQDKKTRHACADAVTKLAAEVDESGNAIGYLQQAAELCMNVQALVK